MKTLVIKRLVPASVILVTLFALWACGASNAPKPSSQNALKIEEQKKEAAAGAPTGSDKIGALVTFLAGDVETLKGGQWVGIDIGDILPQDAIVRVREKSSCELQFGNTAIMRVNEKTEVSLDKIVFENASNRVSVKLNTGSVLSKVAKLAGGDQFQIRTKGAVCGVRGTEFSVASNPDGQTRLRVKAGKVAILPASADLERVAEKMGLDPKASAIVEAAAAKMVESAPVVAMNEEIEVSAQTVAKMDTLLREVEQDLRALSSAPSPTAAAGEKQLAVFTEKVSGQVLKTLDKPKAMNDQSRKELSVIDSMALLSLPETAFRPASTMPAETKKESERSYSPITVSAIPEDAEILMDGALIGKGRIQRLFETGGKKTFSVRRDGYEPQDFTIEAGAETERKIELKPKPKDVSIRALPADAEILIDGTVVGKGSFTGSFLPGTELRVGVRKAGFEEKTTVVKVSLEMASVLKLELGKVSKEVQIQVEPKNARIFIGSAPVGAGRYQALHNVGDKLTVRVEQAGFKEKTLTHEVSESGNNSLSLSLERLRKTVGVTVEPSDAKIFLNGKGVGTGTFSDTFDFGESLVIEAGKEGYSTGSLKFDIGETTKAAYTLKLERERKDVSVTVKPLDSLILLDGRQVGKGTYQGKHPYGEKLDFSFRREGYAGKSISVEVSAATIPELRVELEANAVYARFKASASRIVGLAASESMRIVGTDAAGAVFSALPDGKIVWSLKTANTPNDGTPPVLYGGKVYFAGLKEMVVIDSENGSALGRKTLDAESSNLFGRRPVGTEKGILFPTNQAVELLDPISGTTVKSFKIGGNCLMSPLAYKGRIYLADQLGKVHVLDAGTGKEESVIATGAIQSVAQAIQVMGSSGYFAGRKGAVAALDLDRGTVLWQSKIEDPAAAVFSDLVCSENGVFVFSKNSIYAFNAKNGQQLFPPLKNVSSPPLILGDNLYYGMQSGDFVSLNLVSKAAKKTQLKAKLVSPPIPFGDLIAAGTEGGEVVILNPKGFKE